MQHVLATEEMRSLFFFPRRLWADDVSSSGRSEQYAPLLVKKLQSQMRYLCYAATLVKAFIFFFFWTFLKFRQKLGKSIFNMLRLGLK